MEITNSLVYYGEPNRNFFTENRLIKLLKCEDFNLLDEESRFVESIVGINNIKKLSLETVSICFDIVTGEIVLNIVQKLAEKGYRYTNSINYEIFNLEYFKNRPNIFSIVDAKGTQYDGILEYTIYDTKNNPIIQIPTTEYIEKYGIHIAFNTEYVNDITSRSGKIKAMIYDE